MKGVSAADLYRLKSVTQPLSADSRYFFVENGIDSHKNRYLARIASIDHQGHYQIWADGGINTDPQVSSRNLYYIHQTDHGGRLMRMSLAGGQAEPVKVDGSVSQLHLSGNQLYFKTIQNSETPKFKTGQFPQVRTVTKLVNKEDGYGWLSNTARYHLGVYSEKTYQVTDLMSSSFDFNLQSVSPDHQTVLYLQTTRHKKTDINRAQGAFAYSVNTHQATLINRDVPKGVFHTAQFSPDGKWIALIGNDNRYPSVTVNNFWLYNVKNQRFSNLTKSHDDVDVGFAGGLSTDFAQQRSNVEMHWFSNNDYLFHAYHHGYSQLYLGHGKQIKLVSDRRREVYDFNVVDARHVILSSSKQSQPCELRLMDLVHDDEKTLYNPNWRYEQDHQYAQAVPYKCESADKKAPIYGWVMPSLKHQAPSPVILYVHGGPHDAYGESFFQEFQALANHGYSLVYVNPRGSTTYGQKFETSVIGKFGTVDYQDVMTGLDAALKKFKYLDRNRVYIAGGSYGGFMSLWAIGHTNRFKAAIAQRPLSDWRLEYGVSDIGIRFSRDELGKDLYRDHAEALYRKESPLTYAMNVKTPLLLQHGEYDMRCPACLSEEYFTAVKQTGTEVRYLRYPQGYHGVSRHGLPSLRVQRMRDIMSWLDNHLN
ncbi:MAG: S9 family peptidase [Acetilactobacillus jinshanensis]